MKANEDISQESLLQGSHYHFLCKPSRKERFGWLNSVTVSLTQYAPLSFCMFACLHIYSHTTNGLFWGLCLLPWFILWFCLEKTQFRSLKGLTLAHSSTVTTEEDGLSWLSWPWIWRNGIGAMRVVRWSVQLRENEIRKKDAGAGQDKDRECVLFWVRPIFSSFCVLLTIKCFILLFVDSVITCIALFVWHF